MPLIAKKNQVDAWVGARLPAFRVKQEKWKTDKGEYFQGLISHSVRPADDAETAPDQMGPANHPTDRLAAWDDLLNYGTPPHINLPASFPAALIFNVYEGPQGWGWECRSEFDYAGLRYSKVWNTGPETGRESDWVESEIP
jgi:hypothetical protein